MAKDKKGPALLNAYFKAKQITAAEFARLLDWAPSYLSMLRNGNAKPSVTRAKIIEDETDGAVPAGSWG